MLLDAATKMLVAVAGQGRGFTGREQSAWDWAAGKTAELGEAIDALMADLARRGYGFPRPVH